MPLAEFERLMRELLRVGAAGCRLVYWNVVVERHRPKHLSNALRSLSELATHLHAKDKAFFYRDLIIEEVA